MTDTNETIVNGKLINEFDPSDVVGRYAIGLFWEIANSMTRKSITEMACVFDEETYYVTVHKED